jgi:membrane dipeptidase
LFTALEAHGIPRDNLDGSGERLLRLLETVEARADPAVLPSARKPSVPRANLFLDGVDRPRPER